MPERLRTFWSPAVEAEFNAAYDAVFEQSPVAYEELYIPTRFGVTVRKTGSVAGDEVEQLYTCDD